MKKIFKLGYIHCAGCSVALEDKIKKVEHVKSAQINFVTKIVTVEIENKDSKTTMENIEKAIKEFDKSIEILPADAEEQTRKSQKVGYYLLGASILLWITGIVLQYTINLTYAHLPIYVVSLGLVGYKVWWNAIKNIIKGKVLDETFLMSIASIGAFVIGEYLEGCAVMIFYTIGEIFQHYATIKSEDRIKSLAGLKSETASVVGVDGEITVVDLSLVKVGDKISVNAGEKVPLDGKIISGKAHFNTSSITGETAQTFLQKNDEVISGYIVEDSPVIIEVNTTAENCTVSKIVKMVEEASASKANTEKFIAKFAKVYTPIVVGLALILCFVMPAFWGYTLEAFKLWAYRGLSFLVVSCPCALVLSVPLTFFSGVGACAKSGVLVKGTNFLELFAKTKHICFDKTGTLTTGEFEVTQIISLGEKEESDILELVAYGESFSNHRIAKSIVKHYLQTSGKTINTAWVNGYTEIAGSGIVANIFMEDCIIGNAVLIQENQIEIEPIDTTDTIVYLACSGKLEGYICVADAVKADSKQTIIDLTKLGVDTSILTGDKQSVALSVASSLEIKNCFAELKPLDKTQKIEELKQKGVTAFVGDGINDAPALTTSNVGVAMGAAGSDIAIDTADVVVLTDEPSKVVEAIKIAKNTQKIVVENVIFTIGFKVATLALVSFGLAGMWLAVFADVGVTVLAVLNSLRAMKRFGKKKNKPAKV